METENLEYAKEALKEYRKAKWKEYSANHEFVQKRREYQKKYHQEHKAEVAAYNKEWRRRNPDKVRLYAARAAINWLKKQEALKLQEAQHEQDNPDR